MQPPCITIAIVAYVVGSLLAGTSTPVESLKQLVSQRTETALLLTNGVKFSHRTEQFVYRNCARMTKFLVTIAERDDDREKLRFPLVIDWCFETKRNGFEINDFGS